MKNGIGKSVRLTLDEGVIHAIIATALLEDQYYVDFEFIAGEAGDCGISENQTKGFLSSLERKHLIAQFEGGIEDGGWYNIDQS